MIIFKNYFLIILAIIYLPSVLEGQLFYKLNLESGVYLDLSNLQKNEKLINKIFGHVEYRYGIQNSKINLSVKARPQLLDMNFHSFKYGVDGSYLFNSKNYLYSSEIQYNSYNLQVIENNPLYQNFSILNSFDLDLENNFVIKNKIGYVFRKINDVNSISSKYFFFNPILNRTIDNYTSLGMGLYIQKFDIESNIVSGFRGFSSAGWKYGPNIIINYMRDFIFSAEYKFLIHNSDRTTYPSFEHNINMLSGIIVNKLSFFLLIQLNFVRTKIEDKIHETNPIYFFPTQNDNEVYLKIGYKINKNFSLYAKTGYLKENLYLENLELNGLNLLLGLQIKE